jgi:hypothetical protein
MNTATMGVDVGFVPWHGSIGQEPLAAVFAAKVKGLAITFGVASRGLIDRHIAYGVNCHKITCLSKTRPIRLQGSASKAPIGPPPLHIAMRNVRRVQMLGHAGTQRRV